MRRTITMLTALFLFAALSGCTADGTTDGAADGAADDAGDAPGAAGTPDRETGTLVVLNKGAASATVIDVASGETLATLRTGPAPHELAMASHGRTAVGTDYGSNTLTVIDVPGLEVARRIDLGRYTRPHGIAYLPGDSLVAVTSEQTRTVVVVRVADGEIVQALDTEGGGSHMLAVTDDGGTVVTGNMSDSTVSVLDRDGGRVVGSFGTPPQPEAVAVSGDGRYVWAGSNSDGTVSVVDTGTGELETPFTGFQWPYRILLVPERDLVVIPDLGAERVRFFDLERRQERGSLSLPGDRPQGVALTDDRDTLFLSLSASGEVAVIDLDSFEVVRRIPAGESPDGIGWSPVVVR